VQEFSNIIITTVCSRRFIASIGVPFVVGDLSPQLVSHRHLSDIESILNDINGLPQGGENQVILAQKLIQFLFRIEKNPLKIVS